MAAIVTTQRGGCCGICLEEFVPPELQFTHEGGEGHDGFHKSCLGKWLIHHSTCPLDRQVIDRSSLVSRTDLIRERLKIAMVNASLAVCFGTVVSVAGRVTVAALDRIAEKGRIAKMLPIAILPEKFLAAIIVPTVTIGVAFGSAAIARVAGAGTEITAAASVVGTLVVDRMITTGTEAEAVAGSAITAFAGYAAVSVDRNNVGWGMFVGGCVPLIGLFFNRKYVPQLSTAIPLIAGTAAGILSLIRG